MTRTMTRFFRQSFLLLLASLMLPVGAGQAQWIEFRPALIPVLQPPVIPPLAITPRFPTSADVIDFSAPLDAKVYSNSCYAGVAFVGQPLLDIDADNRVINIRFDGKTTGICPEVYDPVIGAWGDFGTLAAGDWTFHNTAGDSLTFTVVSKKLVWDGDAGDGLWASATNWDRDVVPDGGEACRVAGATVSIQTTDAVAASLEVDADARVILTGKLSVEGAEIAGTLTGDGTLYLTEPVEVSGTVAPIGSLTLIGESSMRIQGSLVSTIQADGLDQVVLPAGEKPIDVLLSGAAVELTATGRATIDGQSFGQRSLTLMKNRSGGEVSGLEAMTVPADGAALGSGIFFDQLRLGDGSDPALVVDVFQAAPGDQNGDMQFEFDDVFAAFVAGGGKYGTKAIASWTEGDFDNDQDFDFDDVFYAFQQSGSHYGGEPYYTPPVGKVAAAAVPEPSAIILLLGCLGLLGWRRCK